MKEQLDKLIKMKEDKNAAKSANSVKLKSVDMGEELQKKGLQMAKKGSRLLEPSTTINTNQPSNKPRPMGSNFNDIQLKPGISILEGGKVKQNKQSLSNA